MWVFGKYSFRTSIQHSVVAGGRFWETTVYSWCHAAFTAPDLLPAAPVSTFLTNWSSQEVIPQVKPLYLASLKMYVELLLEYQGSGLAVLVGRAAAIQTLPVWESGGTWGGCLGEWFYGLSWWRFLWSCCQ